MSWLGDVSLDKAMRLCIPILGQDRSVRLCWILEEEAVNYLMETSREQKKS